MSGFGTNPAGSSAFSFPTLNQPNTTAPVAAPPFSFGAPKTTAAAAPLSTAPLGAAPLGAAPLGAAPAFGVSPLGVKTSINLTATSTPSGIPTLGGQQPGTLFGTAWSGGMFSAGSNAAAVSSAAAPLSSLAPAPTASIAKTGQFTFGTSAPTALPQSQTLLGTPAGTTTTTANVPGFSTSTPQLAPATTQATVPPSAPTLNFSFGSAPNTTVTNPSLGLTVPNFGVAPVSKPQAAAAPTVVSTLSTPAPLPLATLKFLVSSSTTATSSTTLTPVTKTTTAMSMPMFAGPLTSVPPLATPAVTAAVSVAATVAPVTSTPVQPVTSISASVAPTTIATTTPAAAVAAPAPATEEDVMTYSKLQENINKWAMELEKQEKLFLHQATEMNGWDRVIVENSDKLHMLNSKIEKVRKEQRHLDLELDYILSQQNELDYMLKGLEKEWGSVPPSDPERQHTYKVAESLDYKLKLMSDDLKEVVDHMNAMNYPPNDEFNPVMQIVRILNAHMNVLLMVERKTNLAECKAKEVGKLLELCKRDYDRACHLYFD
ncbi:nuclear pore glycoprotein p62 [Hetaerina americana]|uniref:nuclear pore glycoprotein p62 n=1 Tax=Hetaerina americana TaxID=62018 RepID=UPI003A7F4CBB